MSFNKSYNEFSLVTGITEWDNNYSRSSTNRNIFTNGNKSIHFNDNEIILSKNQVINAFIKNFDLQEITQIALEFISGAEVNGFMIWTTSMTDENAKLELTSSLNENASLLPAIPELSQEHNRLKQEVLSLKLSKMQMKRNKVLQIGNEYYEAKKDSIVVANISGDEYFVQIKHFSENFIYGFISTELYLNSKKYDQHFLSNIRFRAQLQKIRRTKITKIGFRPFWRFNFTLVYECVNLLPHEEIYKIIEETINKFGCKGEFSMAIDEDNESIRCVISHDNFQELEYIEASVSRGLILDRIKNKATMTYMNCLDDWKMKKINATNYIHPVQIYSCEFCEKWFFSASGKAGHYKKSEICQEEHTNIICTDEIESLEEFCGMDLEEIDNDKELLKQMQTKLSKLFKHGLVSKPKHKVGKVVQSKLIKKTKGKHVRVEIPMNRSEYLNEFGTSGYIATSGNYMNKVNSNESLARFFTNGTELSSGEKYKATSVGFGTNSEGFISWRHNNKCSGPLNTIGNLIVKLPIIRK